MAKNQNEVNEVVEVTETAPAVVEQSQTTAVGTFGGGEDFNITATFSDSTSLMFSTMQNTDRESAIKIYNAMNNPVASVRDLAKGEVINMTDFIAHPITLLDENTGELVQVIRTVIVDENGNAYHAVSIGVVESIKKIIGIVGQGPWTPPLKVAQRQIKTRKGFYTTSLELML